MQENNNLVKLNKFSANRHREDILVKTIELWNIQDLNSLHISLTLSTKYVQDVEQMSTV